VSPFHRHLLPPHHAITPLFMPFDANIIATMTLRRTMTSVTTVMRRAQISRRRIIARFVATPDRVAYNIRFSDSIAGRQRRRVHAAYRDNKAIYTLMLTMTWRSQLYIFHFENSAQGHEDDTYIR
jgi:hypothetical protein